MVDIEDDDTTIIIAGLTQMLREAVELLREVQGYETDRLLEKKIEDFISNSGVDEEEEDWGVDEEGNLLSWSKAIEWEDEIEDEDTEELETELGDKEFEYYFEVPAKNRGDN